MDKRSILKRNGQAKVLRGMLDRGQEIMADAVSSRNPSKEMSALLKNIQAKKISIEELNENILN